MDLFQDIENLKDAQEYGTVNVLFRYFVARILFNRMVLVVGLKIRYPEFNLRF